ncbi:MAG TPA: hypothetical protein VIH99_07670, partial [Bdellovibrionota bacterium]
MLVALERTYRQKEFGRISSRFSWGVFYFLATKRNIPLHRKILASGKTTTYSLKTPSHPPSRLGVFLFPLLKISQF